MTLNRFLDPIKVHSQFVIKENEDKFIQYKYKRYP